MLDRYFILCVFAVSSFSRSFSMNAPLRLQTYEYFNTNEHFLIYFFLSINIFVGKIAFISNRICTRFMFHLRNQTFKHCELFIIEILKMLVVASDNLHFLRHQILWSSFYWKQYRLVDKHVQLIIFTMIIHKWFLFIT